ncbi:pyridoxal phosphate-dependent aminotransferase [Paenibacillus glufosinatiresistens]|uniref:pyridoxal phosphate-dependent aminotransferase n=1 Tax=Paenibacillus glufosinatiresistens TaxID=3070657 RepID=UPI00286D7B7D|nr:aminotransferase class I/II-fold pyridoxal phosphate-dependent enzyme [Paenibacillus sp. YX.27]
MRSRLDNNEAARAEGGVISGHTRTAADPADSVRLAKRVRDLPPSGIRAFFEAGSGKDVVSLGVGEPAFPMPEPVRKAVCESLARGETAYTSNAGMPELRGEIASYLRRGFGLDYEPGSELLVTVGSSEALDLALRSLLEPGDEVVVPSPGYVAYAPLIELAGGVAVEASGSAADGFKLTEAALEAAIGPRTRAILLNYPSNPTGAIMRAEDLMPIARLVQRHGLAVLSDEVYAELTYEGRHVSIASLPGMKERTVVVSGFSKAFAMTGWRIGYACGPRTLIAAMLKVHQYTAMCAPTTGQVAALASLRLGLEAKEAMREELARRRTFFVEGLRRIGLPCRMPEGAFYAFPSIASTGLTSAEFARRLMEEGGVAAVPGSVFGEGGEGHIRCSYAASPEQLAEALRRMEQFLSRLREERKAETKQTERRPRGAAERAASGSAGGRPLVI